MTDDAQIEAVIAEAIAAHRHQRRIGGYVACTCGKPWSDHHKHVAAEVRLALRARADRLTATGDHGGGDDHA